MIELATDTEARTIRRQAAWHDPAAIRFAWRLMRDAFDPSVHRVVEGIASDGRLNLNGLVKQQAGGIFRAPCLLLVEHRFDWPAGVVQRFWYDEALDQTCFEARLATRLPDSPLIWERIRDGTIARCSVGCDWVMSDSAIYEPGAVDRASSDDPIVCHEFRISEVSLVQDPANPNCYILRQRELRNGHPVKLERRVLL